MCVNDCDNKNAGGDCSICGARTEFWLDTFPLVWRGLDFKRHPKTAATPIGILICTNRVYTRNAKCPSRGFSVYLLRVCLLPQKSGLDS